MGTPCPVAAVQTEIYGAKHMNVRMRESQRGGKRVAKAVLTVLTLVLLGAMLAGCPPGGGGSGDPIGGHTVSITVYDNRGNPLQGAALHLDGAPTPTAVTDASGVASLEISGTASDLVVRKSGYRSYAYLSRDFSAIDSTRVILDYVPDLLSPPGTGTISFTLSGGPAGVMAFVQAWGLAGPVQTGVTLDGSGNGSGTLPAQAGTYTLVVRPNDTTLTAADTFYGVVEPVVVTAGGTTPVTVPLVAGGRELTVDASGGLSGGEMAVRFLLYAKRGFVSFLSTSKRKVAATSLTGEPLTVPSNATNLDTDRTIAVLIESADDGTVTHGWQQRSVMTYYYDRASFLAGPATYSIALPDFAVSAVTPAHDTASVAATPSFGYAAVATPDFVEVVINRIVVDGGGAKVGSVPELTVRYYGSGSTFTVPALTALPVDAYFTYRFTARQDGGNVLTWNRVGNQCFSTGVTAPSTAGVCGP